MEKQQIINSVVTMAENIKTKNRKKRNKVLLTDYAEFVHMADDFEIWTKAINKALSDCEIVVIPERDEPYYIDESIILHSNNRIEAGHAIIQQLPNVKILMLRNENVVDESAAPCGKDIEKDCNISVDGGVWKESRRERGGYGISGMYDNERSMFGVSTAFLLSNVCDASISNVKFVNTGGFAVQIGNAANVVCENIVLEDCFADGIHITGNSENLYIHNIKGNVGDDIVALNMYDWANSSINYGPVKNVFVCDVELSEQGKYKAIRVLPGVYTYKDGSKTDCRAENIVFQKIRGINNFKLYLQTNRYDIKSPEVVGVGSGDYIYFDDIQTDLDSPIDAFDNYIKSDPITGSIAAFEVGANIGNITLENISLKCCRDKFPMSYLLAVGPKSACIGEVEIYDPYIKCNVKSIVLKNIKINGEYIKNADDYIKCIKFDRLYDSEYSSGFGTIENIKCT